MTSIGPRRLRPRRGQSAPSLWRSCWQWWYAWSRRDWGGSPPSVEQQLFLHDLALQEAALRSARAYVFEVFGDAEVDVGSGATSPRKLQLQRLRQATTYATRVAADVVDFAYTWAGEA